MRTHRILLSIVFMAFLACSDSTTAPDDVLQIQAAKDGRSEGKLRSAIHDGVNTSQAVESNGNILSGVWQHVAVTLDNGTLRLYIDGAQDRVFFSSQTPMNSDRPLSIGHEGPPFNGWFYDGLIDDVRVWNVARTDAEIAAHMNRLKGKKTGLVGWWRFNEGQGDVAQDRRKTKNDGRLGNADGADVNDPTWVTDVPVP